MKKFLPHIINHAQSIFIKEKDIADNLALAYKICNEFSSSKNNYYFLAKFDLKKTFDKVNTLSSIDFLQKTFWQNSSNE